MFRTENSLLPVIENNVLLGVARGEEVLAILAAGFQNGADTIHTFSTEG